ncbi:hypothetical protein [Bordetella genomosp. 11]|uniref:Inclusion body protein n=1 Tax=Bordetella genomosp. 11 TaxID=1416808 RepID=A0A261UMI7_9BORD|nr:hypothetical protein [Bordetella genomosp. 11]OZI63094.1 hypothetical protein CAL28_28785 [Bordetella genomosp. 11]
MAANPLTTDCDIQIRILVDDNNVQDGTASGVYIVDNRVSLGSSPQGSATLNTIARKNEKICWRVEPLNPNSKSSFVIQTIGEIPAWGFSGGPRMSPDMGDAAFTGTVEAACGATAYNIDIYASLEDGDEATLSVKPSLAAS